MGIGSCALKGKGPSVDGQSKRWAEMLRGQVPRSCSLLSISTPFSLGSVHYELEAYSLLNWPQMEA